MKKVLFSLIATVLFLNLSVASTNFKNHGINPKEGIHKMVSDDVYKQFCIELSASVGFVSVSTTVCFTPRTNGHSNWVDVCVGCKSKNGTYGQVFLENFKPDVLETVSHDHLTEITITKASICEMEGSNYTIHPGTYTIETAKDGALFISVYAEKV